MPFVPYNLALVAEVLQKRNTDKNKTHKILTLSYPDLCVTENTIRRLFGNEVMPLPIRADSEATLQWHKRGGLLPCVFDTKALFEKIGYQMDTLDRVEGRGGETLHDLSNPLPRSHPFRNSYDLVFDCISNQVFNVAQAWWTMVECCRVGGHILSVTPVTMVNQGFWNVSPTAYKDFAQANGLELISITGNVGVYDTGLAVALNTSSRIRDVPDDTMNVVLMRKLESRVDPVWPIMTKFQKYPTCHLPPNTTKR